MKLPIYMDYQATTPVDPRVLDAMLPYFTQEFGNAASRSHAFGWRAEEAVEEARARIAALIHADPKEIVFTSGATESDNLALLGVAEAYRDKGNHLVVQATEHKAVLDAGKRLQETGGEVTFLPVDRNGQVDPDALRRVLTPRTVLVSIMLANNEIGTVQRVADLARIARDAGALFHTDAAQALATLPIDVQALGVDLVSITAHKAYGPKGIGALYVRRKNPRVRVSPQMHGGGHERGRRSGTLPVPLIVGFGAACDILSRDREEEAARLAALRDRLQHSLSERLRDIHLNGHPTERLPNNLNLSFAGVEGEALMMGMTDVAVSSGSACSSGSQEPSYVLEALGVPADLAYSSLRFGVGRFTTAEEVDHVVERVVQVVTRLRAISADREPAPRREPVPKPESAPRREPGPRKKARSAAR